MKVLVTGGLGYIGSHVTTLLLERNHEVIILDDLSNTSLSVLNSIENITQKKPFYEQINLCDAAAVKALFDRHNDVAGVIHFAAHKAVAESVAQPLKYYHNNIEGLLNLLDLLVPKKIPLLFSSSCTVYGNADELPITEHHPVKAAASPYGATKQMGEQIITDCCNAQAGFHAILLRYFNPIGAHTSAQIGEAPQGVPQNLIPYLVEAAAGKRPALQIFGTDYPTPDGSCIRDYIHVMDLADAHIVCLAHLFEKKQTSPTEIYNVGSGKGHSVLEVVTAFEKATGMSVPTKIVGRRKGDVIQAYADTTKINTQLGWETKYSLEEALRSAWAWEQRRNN